MKTKRRKTYYASKIRKHKKKVNKLKFLMEKTTHKYETIMDPKYYHNNHGPSQEDE